MNLLQSDFFTDQSFEKELMEIKDPEFLKKELLEKLKDGQKYAVMEEAVEFAEKAHKNQKRDEGTSYILHPLRVAIRLYHSGYRSPEILAAALLHDVLEDSQTNPMTLKKKFGSRIGDAVLTLSKQTVNGKISNPVYFQRLQSAGAEIQAIKIFDRIDNLYSLRLIDNHKKKEQYLQETQKYFLDLAKSSSVLKKNLDLAISQIS